MQYSTAPDTTSSGLELGVRSNATQGEGGAQFTNLSAPEAARTPGPSPSGGCWSKTSPRVKGMLLIFLAVGVVGGAVIGGVCGSGKCSGSAASDSSKPRSLVYVTGSVQDTTGQPVTNAVATDFQAAPVAVDSTGKFSLWGEVINGVAAIPISAPDCIPSVLTVRVNAIDSTSASSASSTSTQSVTGSVQLLRVNAASGTGSQVVAQTITGNSSGNGTVSVSFDNSAVQMTVSGLNDPALDNKQFQVRAALIAPQNVPGLLATDVGASLQTGGMFYFDLTDPVTNQKLDVPAGVAARFETTLNATDIGQADPWKWWKLGPDGRWSDPQDIQINPNGILTHPAHVRSQMVSRINSNRHPDSHIDLETFNTGLMATSNGYWNIDRAFLSRCIVTKLLKSNGQPCIGVLVQSDGVIDGIVSNDYTASDGSFCVEGPPYLSGRFMINNDRSSQVAAVYGSDLDFSRVTRSGTCAARTCDTIAAHKLPASLDYLCPDPATPPPPPPPDCPAGTQFTASGCSNCPAGRFSASINAADCTICPAGTSSATRSSSCSTCSAGTFSSAGSSACTSCRPGSFQPNGRGAVCTPCPSGRFSAGSGSTECSNCAAGTFQALPGQVACVQCPPGAYQDQTGRTTCIGCPAGQFSNLTGSTACRTCSVGSAAAGSSTACALCSAGTFSNNPSNVCPNCAAGTFSDHAGASVCTSCAAGTFGSASGSSVCLSCPAGKFSGAAGQTTCTLCPANTYSSNASSTVCQQCGAGAFSPAGSSACGQCPPGSIFENQGCAACPIGKSASFQDTQCTDCAVGRFASSTGSSVCSACSAGTFSAAFGASVCTQCAAGSFQNVPGSTVCSLCSINSFSASAGAATCTACGFDQCSSAGATSCSTCERKPPVWTELVTFDCDAGIHLFNTHSVFRSDLSFPIAKRLLNSLHDMVLSDAKARCPSITDAELSDHFDLNLGTILRLFDPTSSFVPLSCNSVNTTRFHDSLASLKGKLNVTFPVTCTPSTWAAGAGCNFQVEILDGLQIQVAADRCSNSSLPFISVTCKGALCNSLLKPCSSDSDCDGGANCNYIGDDLSNRVGQALTQWLSKSTAWSSSANISCSSSKLSLNDNTISKYAVDKLVGFLTAIMPNQTSAPNGLRFCGLDRFSTMVNSSNWNCAHDTTESRAVSCSEITAWDGVMPNAEAASSARRKSGAYFRFPAIAPALDPAKPVLIVDYTNTTFQVLPATAFGAISRTPQYQLFVDQLAEAVTDVAECRNGHGNPSSVTATRMLPWTTEMFLYGLTNTTASVSSGFTTDFLKQNFLQGDLGYSVLWKYFEKVPPTTDDLLSRFLGWAPLVGSSAVTHTLSVLAAMMSSPLDGYLEAAMQVLSLTGVISSKPVYNYYYGYQYLLPSPWHDPSSFAHAWNWGWQIEELFSQSFNGTSVVLQMPQGCTYGDYISTGRCRFQYKGLKTAFGLDTTLRVTFSRDPAHPQALPQFSLDCVGTDCVDLAKIPQDTLAMSCSSNADCASGSCMTLDLGSIDFVPQLFWARSMYRLSVVQLVLVFSQDVNNTAYLVDQLKDYPSYYTSGYYYERPTIDGVWLSPSIFAFTAFPQTYANAYMQLYTWSYIQPYNTEYFTNFLSSRGITTFSYVSSTTYLTYYYNPQLQFPFTQTPPENISPQVSWEWFNFARNSIGLPSITPPDAQSLPGICKPQVFNRIIDGSVGFTLSSFFNSTIKVANGVASCSDLEPYVLLPGEN